MTTTARSPRTYSVTEAASMGLPRLVRDAEHGADLVVERHGKAVAAVVSMSHLERIRQIESDLRDSVLLLARAATDNGTRTDLDDVIEALGFTRAQLQAELKEDLAAGRE